MLGRLITSLLLAALTAGCVPFDNGALPEDPRLLDQDGDGYSPEQGDCDDLSTASSPVAPELCNEADDDCDGATDEGFDQDNDGYATCQYVTDFIDCDDSSAASYPGAVEICDGNDNDCDAQRDEGLDKDADGVSSCAFVQDPADCDDNDPDNYPGNRVPLCDGLDNDCDGDADEGFDNDADGVPRCSLAGLPADCDDLDDDIFPGNDEACDADDNDCDGDIDEGFDNDSDGYFSCRSQTSGGEALPKDCDDNQEAIHPGAQERCSPENLGVDEDCDTLIDDADPTVLGQSLWYEDKDSDGFGVSDSSQLACAPPAGYVALAADCDDTDALVNPNTVWYADTDLDGYGDAQTQRTQCLRPTQAWSLVAGDCDDNDITAAPGLVEACDGADNDCDGGIDEGLGGDVDGDGFNGCGAGGLVEDCDDGDAHIYPGAEEPCDGADGDCDGAVDEGHDLDGDGFTYCGSDTVAADCDDSNASLNPAAVEVCDLVDHNCDGVADDGFDTDGDGFSTCALSGGQLDCDDTDAAVSPDGVEICDRVDQDCDGAVDETFDLDGDGYFSCDPTGSEAVDCEDDDPEINPGAAELCDRLDQNCDGVADEAFDLDGDGFFSCGPESDPAPLDCDDSDAGANPDATEVCDGADTDCSGGSGDLYVSANAADNPDFLTIQSAIEAASAGGCVVGVAPGTYVERLNFKGNDVYVRSEAGPEVTIIDGSQGTAATEAVVLFKGAEPATAGLEGFTITGGSGHNSGDFPLGGGVRLDVGAQATVRGNIISGNRAEAGGGIACNLCGPALLEDNQIINNLAAVRVGPLGVLFNGVGGGLWATGAQLTLRGNVFYNNVGMARGGGAFLRTGSQVQLEGGSWTSNITDPAYTARGGAVHVDADSTLTASDVLFESNQAYRGGAISVEMNGTLIGTGLSFVGNLATGRSGTDEEGWGGAVYGMGDVSAAPRVELTGCLFSGNYAGTLNDGRGGAVFVAFGSGLLTQSVIETNGASLFSGGVYIFSSDLPVTNNLFSENEALLGGALVYDAVVGLEAVNNTFVSNRSTNIVPASGGGSSIYLFDSNGTIYNNIFDHNTASIGGTVYYYTIETAYDPSTLQYNDFFGNTGGNGGGAVGAPVGTRGNLGVDPLFVGGGDVHLKATSPLLDAGHPGAVYLDLDGSPAQMGAYGGPGGGWDAAVVAP